MESPDFEENDAEPSQSYRISDVLFSKALQMCGSVLLKKSQTPAMKAIKKKAMNEMIDFILLEKGIIVNEQQISKKLNNMKNRVKCKSNHNKTRNKKIELNSGEMMLLEMLGAEENPSVSKMTYGVSAGVARSSRASINNDSSLDNISAGAAGSSHAPIHNLSIEFVSTGEAGSGSTSIFDSPSDDDVIVVQPKKAEVAGTKGKYETEDTKKMNTGELQRFVLLQQLEMFAE